MKPEVAYRLVRSAIDKGDLIRPSCCSRCGVVPKCTSDGRAAIQAHHHDYSKPLDVEWICASCHRKETPLPKVIGAPNFGEKNGFSKLTEAVVIQMRSIRAQGYIYKDIGAMFGVSKHAAMKACKGITWSHVKSAAAPKP